VCQRTRDSDALALATAKVAGLAMHECAFNADVRE
jgi:hypothetical protein